MYEPSYDRFSGISPPKEPVEVGDCSGCGRMMYDYEVVKCLACDSEIHEGCIETCEGEKDNGEICGQIGCRACLKENLLCEECKNRESEVENADNGN